MVQPDTGHDHTHLAQKQNHPLSYSLKVGTEELDKDAQCQPLACTYIVAQTCLHMWRGPSLRSPHSLKP